jgi:hypothetical protein
LTLASLPADFQFARDQLHQIAFFAVSPARYAAEERMGLVATPRGFGTPRFAGRVARVEGNLLVHEQEGNVATQTITTIRAAAEFFGHAYDPVWFTDFRDPLSPMDPDRPLTIEPAPALALADWFRFGHDLLSRLRPHGSAGDEVSEIQLWPEHFDVAIEMGSAAEGRRASYGASPGDPGHLEPYVYVSAWSETDESEPYWNDRHFKGASLPYALLTGSADPTEEAMKFLLQGYEILHR